LTFLKKKICKSEIISRDNPGSHIVDYVPQRRPMNKIIQTKRIMPDHRINPKKNSIRFLKVGGGHPPSNTNWKITVTPGMRFLFLILKILRLWRIWDNSTITRPQYLRIMDDSP